MGLADPLVSGPSLGCVSGERDVERKARLGQRFLQLFSAATQQASAPLTGACFPLLTPPEPLAEAGFRWAGI